MHAGAAAAAAAALKAAPSASSGGDHLALARHLAALPLDGESVPRFFIVGDDARQEEELQRAVWALNLTGAKGARPAQALRFSRPEGCRNWRSEA